MGHLKNTRYINIPVYNVSMEDDILNLDTSIGITLVFPNIQDSGCMYADKRWYVNDATGGAAGNPVTITAVSGIQINDAASQQLSTANFGACVFATNREKYIVTGSGSGGGGTTIVTAPFTPSNTSIVVGDDFQEVAEKAQGQINDIVTNVTELQNNEYKITYFAEINAATGTITKPTGSTILLDQFAGGVDAYVSTITNGQPTGDFPTTAGGVLVDVTSFDTSGNFVLSGTPSAYPCALIYIIKISAADYQNLTTSNILEAESSFGKAPIVSPVFQTSINGAFLTASLPLVTDSSKNIVSRSIANFRADIGVDVGTIVVTSGTSFTTPSTITSLTTFFITLVGGGGGGAGTNTTNSTAGGGAGGYCFVKVTGLSPSTTYTCAIGAAGAGGAAGGANNGANGGKTTLTIGATTYTANGGSGSVSAVSTSGGAGGTATNGDINITGQSGGDSPAANAAIIAGEGGNSAMGWGYGGQETRNGVTGNAGIGYGAGGAGGKSAGGGAGTQGIIYCEYFN